MVKTLRDWLPCAPSSMDAKECETLTPLLDVAIVREVRHRDRATAWPGRHKNVQEWCELANGRLVGFNENPAIGWSFPTMRKPK